MSNDPIKISVIMLAYNHAPYIRKALDSVLAQKFEGKIEVLVGEDCSTDDTRAILLEIAQQYPNLIIPVLQEKNVGPTKNFYAVLQRAQGKYLAFLECDDFWTDENKLQIQYDFLEAHPENAAVYHKIICVDQDSTVVDAEYEVFSSPVFTLHDYEKGDFPSQTASCLCRNIFLDKEKDYSILHTAHWLIGDRTLLLFLLEQGRIDILPQRMSAYRKIRMSNAENACSLQLKRNLFGEQWHYYNALGQYAKHNNISIDMEYLKQITFIQAIERLAHSRKKTDVTIVLDILKHSEAKYAYVWFLLRVFCERICRIFTHKKRYAWEIYFGDAVTEV